MGTFITGPDPSQAVWPVIERATGASVTRPTGDAAVGGSYPTVLGDNSDTTYMQEKTANQYYRVKCAALALPANARITMVSAAARARLHSGNTAYKDFLVCFGDYSKGYAWDAPGGTVHGALGTTFRTYTSASKYLNSAGKLFTQNDINKGIFAVAGLNTVYGSKPSANGADISDMWIRYAYDLPPTATITSPTPSQTISNTAAPIITWDYSDDFQPQAKYRVTVFNGSTLVYDSGLVTSSDTFHVMTSNLANGTYTVHVRVYQKWSLPVGGDFPAASDATQTFTVSLTSLGTPRLTATPSTEHVNLICYPDINLLSFDASTMDNGIISWISGWGANVTVAATGAPVSHGNLSLAVTLVGAGAFMATSTNEIAVTPGQVLKGAVYINPLTLSGRTATLRIQWRDINAAQLSTTSGSATTLATNTWTQVPGANFTAPASAAYAQVEVVFGGYTNGDTLYVDDAGMWWQVDTATIPPWTRGGFFESTQNMISYSDSTFEDTSFTWVGDANTNVAQSTTHAFHATASLNLTRAVTGTGSVVATLGTVASALSITPGAQYVAYGWAYTDAARICALGFNWYKSDLTPSATAQSLASTSALNNVWTNVGNVLTAPSDAAYAVPVLQVTLVNSTSENHYFDGLSFYPYPAAGPVTRFWRGYYPNTDVAPTLLIEYSDDLVTWHALSTQLVYSNTGSFNASDYTIPTNPATRSYRASMSEVENAQELNSPYSSVVFTSVTLQNVWMHVDSDPVDTSYNFKFDGGGRTENIDASAVQVPIEGLAYGFAQYGVQSLDSIAVQIHLDTANDVAAMMNLAQTKGLVVFRDQRGRVARGVMGAVQFTDFQPGVGAEVSFTLQQSGVQP